jgi:hypothetical protein
MPESVLSRIVRASSAPGQLVFDPFAGSGTTLVVARRLGRDYLGTELSEDYVKNIRKRVKAVKPLGTIDAFAAEQWPQPFVAELLAFYLEGGVTTDMLHDNPVLMDAFVQHFNARLELSGCRRTLSGEEIWSRLESLRRSNDLGKLKIHSAERPGLKPRPVPTASEGAVLLRRNDRRRKLHVDDAL